MKDLQKCLNKVLPKVNASDGHVQLQRLICLFSLDKH